MGWTSEGEIRRGRARLLGMGDLGVWVVGFVVGVEDCWCTGRLAVYGKRVVVC